MTIVMKIGLLSLVTALTMTVAKLPNAAADDSSYTCTTAPCVTLGTKGNWMVGEIKTLAFGGDSKSIIVKELMAQGWVECAGQPLDRNSFKTLANLMGTTWGSGNGSTDFYVPDLRGAFLRGWDHSGIPGAPDRPTSGGDQGNREAPRAEIPSPGKPGNVAGVGSYEKDSLQDHQHAIRGQGSLQMNGGGAGFLGVFEGGKDTNQTTGVTAGRNSAETRPKNFDVLFVIYTGAPATLDQKRNVIVRAK